MLHATLHSSHILSKPNLMAVGDKGEPLSEPAQHTMETLKLMYHKKVTSIKISEPAFSTTIFMTKCTKSDGPAGQCARASCSNLAKLYRNPHSDYKLLPDLAVFSTYLSL